MKTRARAGAVIGLILSAALTSVAYLGWKIAGLPFPPFDLFDWFTRELPGPLVTFAIDTAVVVLRVFEPASTAAAAKSGEQALAVCSFLAAGAAAGAAFFSLLGLSREPALVPGAILGGVLGGVAILAEHSLRRISSGFHLDTVWMIGTFLLGGLALGAAFQSLVVRHQPATLRARRQFLQRAAIIAGIPASLAAAWVVLGRRRAALGARWSDAHTLPNADAHVMAVPGTRPEFTPIESHYRIDVDTRVPSVDPVRWRLKVGGMVDRPLEFTLDELRRQEPLHQFVTLECISNPLGGDLIGTTRWSGVSLHRLLGPAQVQRGATHLKVTSADGFFELISLDTIHNDARVMLAYAWDDLPLLEEHGFPLRVYIPGVYGMKQPKWVNALDLVDRWEPGYWVSRGWDRDGVMKATSVVDAATGNRAGGIAHAGARGISRVEVRVDAGDWRDAQLRDPLSDTAWTIWRADVDAPAGDHLVTVRCYEADGTPQHEPFHSRRLKAQG